MIRSYRPHNASFFCTMLGAVYNAVCECWCRVVAGWGGAGRKGRKSQEASLQAYCGHMQRTASQSKGKTSRGMPAWAANQLSHFRLYRPHHETQKLG